MFDFDLTFSEIAAGIGTLAVAGTGIYAAYQAANTKPPVTMATTPAAAAAQAPAPTAPAVPVAPATPAASSEIPWRTIALGAAAFVAAILILKAIK